MKITPKPPERIASQVAEFAHERLAGDRQQNALQHAVEIATNHPFATPETEPSASHNSYLQFLREGQRELQQDIDFFESMLQAYPTYEPEIATLMNEISTLENPKSHPQFLGSGNNAKAFWFDHNDKRYVAKIPHRPESLAVHEQMRAFTRGNNIANLQKLAAASPEGKIIVTELIPGKNLNKLTLEDYQAIPSEHVARAIELLKEMNKAGLAFDPKADNVMYDKDIGFTILDYARKKETEEDNIPKDIMYFSYLIAPGISRDTPDSESIAQQKTTLRERFYTVLQQTSPELTEAVKEEQAKRDASFSKIPTIEELMARLAEQPTNDL